MSAGPKSASRRTVLRTLAGGALAAFLAACGRRRDDPGFAAGGTSAPPSTVDDPLPQTEVATTLAPPPSSSVPLASTLPPTTLPTPKAIPTDPYAEEPDTVLGRLTIDRIKLDVPLREGVTLTTLDKGPGHWPGTATPGGIGNVVVAGHRVTHSKPFRYIDTIEVGDPVVFTLNDGSVHTYRAVSNEVVADTATWIVRQSAASTATLFACHPPGSARQRFVVHLALEA